MQFSYVNSTRIIFGEGQINTLKRYIPQDHNILVMYGGGSIKTNGVYQQVSNALKRHEWLEFAGVAPNPTAEALQQAIDLSKAKAINFILAVGGGSVIDGAKYVAAAACYDGDGWDILTGKHRVKTAIPLAVVLTLPATGSESNSASVITRAASHDKLSFMSPAVQPVFAVLDPDVMKTLPERQLANGLVDAWVHICEQYLTFPTGAMVQDGYAEVLLRNLHQLAKQFNQRDDKWRENLMWTANQALNGLLGAGVPQDWATHMIGHELTALYGVDHARSLAIVQPSLLRHRLTSKKAKLEQMGRQVFHLPEGNSLAEQTVDAIESFYHQLGVATQLTEYQGPKTAAIDAIVSQLNKHGMTALGEHRDLTIDQSKAVLQSAVA